MMTARQDLSVPGSEAPAPGSRPGALIEPSVDHEASLRGAGLRVTSPRLATLAAIGEHPHADADEIATAVREKLGTVSKQAVYDVLHALTAADLVRRVALDERRARFELHRHDNHHHLVCRSCGRIEDVACAVGEAPCLDAATAPGAVIEQADVVYRGLCAACATPPAPSVD